MNQPTMNTFAVKESRHNNFDFLRFFLATLVIFAHAHELMNRPEPFTRLTHDQMSSGGVAVTGFFILSGFLITKSWMQAPQFGVFLRKRLSRIFPGFVVALLFCVLIVGPLSGVSLPAYFHNRQTYKFLLQAVGAGGGDLPGVFEHNFMAGNVNGSLWTIRVEFLCYLLVALLGVLNLLSIPRAVVGLLFLSLLAKFAITYVTSLQHIGLLIGFLTMLPPFLAGSVFYLYQDRIPRHPGLTYASLGVIAVCGLVGGGLTIAMTLCGAYLLFTVGFSSRLHLQNFGRKGDISYGIYLYAFPIQQLLVLYLPHSIHPFLYFLLALPPTYFLAWFSWHFVEKRFLRRTRTTSPQPVSA